MRNVISKDEISKHERETPLPEVLGLVEGVSAVVQQPILVLDGELRILFANPSFYQAFRITPGEVERRIVYELSEGQWNIPELRHLLEDLVPRQGMVDGFEVEHHFPEIGRRRVLLNARQLGGRAGGDRLILLALEVVTEDRTEQLRAQAKLAQEDGRRRRTIESAPAILAYLDRDLRYLLLNRTYQEWFGLSPDDLIGKTLEERFGAEEFRFLAPFCQRALAGEVVSFERSFPCPSGLQRTLHVTYTPDWNERGQVEGLMVLGTDISDRKAIEMRLGESERRQAALVILGDRTRDLKDKHTVIYASMELAGTTLEAARAGYGKVDATQEFVTIENDWTGSGVKTLAGTYRFSDFGADLGQKLQRGELVCVADVTSDPLTQAESERWHALQIKAVINVPLIENGRLVAILFIQDTRRRSWTEADITFVRKVADRTWSAAERAEALQALRESEEFTRSVLASTPDCVAVLDLEGRLLTMNEGGCVQMEIDDLSGRVYQPWVAFWGEAKESAEQALAVAREGRSTRFEGFCPTAKGTPRWWEVVVSPVRAADGSVVRILCISRDITERQLAEQERTRLTSELKRSNEDLSQFAHTVAHDLQSPLRGVLTFAQLLERRTSARLAAEDKEFLGQITDSARRMGELVDALLRFAQVGQGEIEQKIVPMTFVVETASRTLQAEMEAHGAELRSGPLPLVAGDAVQLVQLLQNLIGNALKYRRPQAAPVISIEARREKEWELFSVRDNGEGIAAEYLERVFEPLQRLHGEEVPGTGLGLATCHRIVSRHGGRIWVESQPGAGSTFYFTLPAAMV